MSEYNKVYRNTFDGNNLFGWGWKLPVILFGHAGEGHRQEEAMLVMVGDGMEKKWMEIILGRVGIITPLVPALSSQPDQLLAEIVVDYQTQEEP